MTTGARPGPFDVLVLGMTGSGVRSTWTVTFAPGEVEEEIRYALDGDLADENDELVEFAPVAWTINDAFSFNGVLSILDDDETEVTIDDVVVTEGDSGTTTAVFTMSRSQAGLPITIGVATFSISGGTGG